MKWAEKSTKNKELRTASLAGYLWKMKRKHKFHLPQWNKRWFSIEGKFLKWYQKEDTKVASGEISLLDITSMNRFENSGGVYRFSSPLPGAPNPPPPPPPPPSAS
jgi:hypothetical protein